MPDQYRELFLLILSYPEGHNRSITFRNWECLYYDSSWDIRWNIAWALRKSLGLRPSNFPRAQAISHRISLLLSSYRYNLLKCLRKGDKGSVRDFRKNTWLSRVQYRWEKNLNFSLRELGLGTMMFLHIYTIVFVHIRIHQTSTPPSAGTRAHELITWTKTRPVCCISTQLWKIAESPQWLSVKTYPRWSLEYSDLPLGKSEYPWDHPWVNFSRQPLRTFRYLYQSLVTCHCAQGFMSAVLPISWVPSWGLETGWSPSLA